MMAREVSLAEHHAFETKYRLRESRGAAVDGAVLSRLHASSLLLVAPHCTAHYRNGRRKPAEVWTGAIAETLSHMLGANVITALSPRIEDYDATTNDSFLAAVMDIIRRGGIRLAVDIHGLAGRHGLDINIGTAGIAWDEPVKSLSDGLEPHFSVDIDRPYQGVRGIAGVINRAPGGVCAVQLEIGPRLRRPATTLADLRHLGRSVEAFHKEVLRVCGA